MGGVKVAPPYELQPRSQSLVPAHLHLHLHAEGVELTGQSLQNVLRSLGRCSQGWSEGRRAELGGLKTVVQWGTAPPRGGGEAEELLLCLRCLPLGADEWRDGQVTLGQQALPLTCLGSSDQGG